MATSAKRPEMEAVLTMAPPPRLRSSGMARFVARKTPERPSSIVWGHTASSMSPTSASRLRPAGSAGWPRALLCRMSRRPKAWTAPATIWSMPSALLASAAMATAVPPARAISPVTASALALSMSATATLAPRAAKPMAVARPIPDPAPETSATLPSNRIAASLLPRLEGAGLLERHDPLHARAQRRPAAGNGRGLHGFEELALGGAVLDGPAHVGHHTLEAAPEGED